VAILAFVLINVVLTETKCGHRYNTTPDPKIFISLVHYFHFRMFVGIETM
jgi:hypothetical protein